MSFDVTGECLSVADENAVVLSANAESARVIGRPLDAIVGRSGRDWTYPKDVTAGLSFFSQSVRNQQPARMVRRIVRPDGCIALTQVDLFPYAHENQRLVLVRSKPVLVSAHGSLNRNQAQIACYVAEIAEGLARMAADCGLTDLALSIDDLASRAWSMDDWLDLHGHTQIH